MDRQEAIQTLSKVGKISVSYAEDLYDSFIQADYTNTTHTRKSLNRMALVGCSTAQAWK